MLRHRDGCIPLTAGQHRHLAKAAAGSQAADLALLAASFFDINIQRTFHGEVEGVSTPFALSHYYFAAVIGKQANVWAHALPSRVYFPFNDHFQIVGVLQFPIYFCEEFGGEFKRLKRRENRFFVSDFARHEGSYTTLRLQR